MSLSRSLQYAFIAIVTLSVGFSLYQWNASRASTAKTAPNNGLVGYWSFNEGTGTLAGDASVNKNTGTLTNGPTWVSGKLGQALNFDGVNDYVNVPSPVITAYPATITAWVKVPAGATTGFPITITDSGDYSAWGISASPTQIRGFTSASYQGADSYLPLSVDATQWTFVSFVLTNATSRTLYVNNLTPVTDTTNRTPISLDVLNIGRIGGFWASHGFDNWFTGQVDEVRIYNRALSGTEITNLYNLGAEKLNVSPTASLTSGLVGYWTFDGKDTPWTSSSAGTATDRSGNGNTGTLTNMSRATSPVSGILGQALKFDGVNQYITTTNTTSFDNLFSSAITLCAWAKFPNFTNYNRLITIENNAGTDYDAWIQAQQTSGIVQFGAGGVGKFKTSTTALSANIWYHLCGVTDYTAGGTKIFINGVEDAGSLASTPTYTADKGYLDIGRLRSGGGSNYGTGTIDDVRIYNRALSATEVQSLYDLGASDKVNSSVSQNQGVGRLDSGLVGYWKLDDASGTTATDSSVNANNGTLTGGPTWGAGHIGSAVDFTGTEYVSIPNSAPLQITGNLSVSFWIYMTSYAAGGGAWTPIINKFNIDSQNEFNFRFSDSTTGQYYYGDGSGANGFTTWNPSADIPLNNWTHVVLTRNLAKNEAAIYFNGVKKRTGTTSGAVTSTTQPVQIGAGPNGGVSGRSFDGNIDEVRIYNRAISDDEISQLYRLTAPTGVDTSLKGYWSFNGPDLSGTTAYDRSGAGNNGTLTNGPTKTIGKSGQALSFDGTNDLVDAGDMPSIEGQSAVTISAWMKPSALVDWASVASKYVSLTSDTTLNEGGTGLGSNSGFIASIRNGSDTYGYTGSGKLSVGNWTFVSMVFDGTQTGNANRLKIYVNGVNEALTFNGTIPATTVSNSQNMLIGKTGSASNYFNGSIDEVRIYNRALSATEVAALYNSGR